ncbi:MAG: 3-deoxy-7-phosphoheptulonate synthase [Clostridiales bacterium]|nr:3-deoxy-7-phosphoheptulonate synthase [Clostridiales bacterium]
MKNDKLDALRAEIDGCDSEIVRLFEKRMGISLKIAEYKKENGIPVFDGAREAALKEKLKSQISPEFADDISTVYSTILASSRAHQKKLIGIDAENDMSAKFIKKLPIPAEIKEKYPLSPSAQRRKAEYDAEIADIILGKSQKKLLIVGPCSADREDALLDFCERLSRISEKVSDKLLTVARVYTSKPRTLGDGYKGILHSQGENESVFDGIYASRALHVGVIEKTGLPTADEMLYPANYRYFSDLLSYVAVGARSVENQEHRFVSSGISVPVGMKNSTSGDTDVMLDAIHAAQKPHDFIYRGWEVSTRGNALCHAVLRGGKNAPNYDRDSLLKICADYEKAGLENPAFIVDASHANSRKDFSRQPEICHDVLDSVKNNAHISKMFRGFMIESYIEDGAQDSPVTYGKSLTDACLGIEKTEKLILEIADKL